MQLQTEWTPDRDEFANQCVNMGCAKILAKRIGSHSASLAGEVAYELIRLLDIDVPPVYAITLSIECPDLAKKIFEKISEEIPF